MTIKQAYFNESFKIPENEKWLLDEINRLRKMDGWSKSEFIRQALKEYVEKHKAGNPQKPLLPHIQLWEIPVVEKRRENLEWFQSFIERNPGMSISKLTAFLSMASGLKRKTITEYLKTMRMAGVIFERRGKFYVKGYVQTSERT